MEERQGKLHRGSKIADVFLFHGRLNLFPEGLPEIQERHDVFEAGIIWHQREPNQLDDASVWSFKDREIGMALADQWDVVIEKLFKDGIGQIG